MRKDLAKLTIGAFAAMLLLAPPVLAAQDQTGQAQQQASPSQEPAQHAKTAAVKPGAVGKHKPGSQAVGSAQPSPSQLPAQEATPGAVEAKPQTK